MSRQGSALRKFARCVLAVGLLSGVNARSHGQAPAPLVPPPYPAQPPAVLMSPVPGGETTSTSERRGDPTRKGLFGRRRTPGEARFPRLQRLRQGRGASAAPAAPAPPQPVGTPVPAPPPVQFPAGR